MAKTFKVVKTVWQDEKDENEKLTGIKVKTLETVATGLEWDAAKEIRKASKGDIFEEK